MKSIAVTIILAMLSVALAIPATAWADGTEDEEVQASAPERMTWLDARERAPWDGILTTQQTLVDWRMKIELLERRLELDVNAAEEKARVELELAETRIQLERERRRLLDQAYRDKVAGLSGELEKVRAKLGAWHRNPFLWYVAGFVSAGLVALALGLAF